MSRASWPVVLSLAAVSLILFEQGHCNVTGWLHQVTCLYARAAHDIFADKVADDYGTGYFFSSYGVC